MLGFDVVVGAVQVPEGPEEEAGGFDQEAAQGQEGGIRRGEA